MGKEFLEEHKERDPATVSKPVRESFFDSTGSRVRRRSSDHCWPLRSASGAVWADL